MSSTATVRKRSEVLVRERTRGEVYALRFWAYGNRRYKTLGYKYEGWAWDKAEEELQNILADVRRGLWVPPTKRKRRGAEEAPRADVPPFGEFASGLVAEREGQVAEKTSAHERWALGHVLPFFGDRALGEIDVEAIDEYRAFKVKESEARARAIDRGRSQRNTHGHRLRPLSPGSINRTIDFLQWVLSVAIEYKRFGLAENPAEGRRRRLRESRPARVHIDSAAQVEALLEAAAELDRGHRCELTEREAIVATLLFAGPRAHELCDLRWRDVDLAGARIFIGRSKTAAGVREIGIRPILRDVLVAHKAAAYRCGPDDLVFPTQTGGRRDPDNLRRVLAAVRKRANELLTERDLVPLPQGLTTHKLRHAFASILVALGEDPILVMRQIGHTDPAFTLRVYTHMMSRDPTERERLRALVRGEWVIARQAPPPRPVELAEYEGPLVRVLADRGGSASRREIVAAVGEAMAARHGPTDLEPLPSGPPRWKPRLGKVLIQLVRRGWLVTGSSRGEWGLTERGWAKARREEQQDRRAPEPVSRVGTDRMAATA
jgi:integrase